MDNASFHKKSNIRQLLEQHGHMLLPLPPYSPHFNPIEESFAILKKRCLFVNPHPAIDQLIRFNFGAGTFTTFNIKPILLILVRLKVL